MVPKSKVRAGNNAVPTICVRTLVPLGSSPSSCGLSAFTSAVTCLMLGCVGQVWACFLRPSRAPLAIDSVKLICNAPLSMYGRDIFIVFPLICWPWDNGGALSCLVFVIGSSAMLLLALGVTACVSIADLPMGPLTSPRYTAMFTAAVVMILPSAHVTVICSQPTQLVMVYAATPCPTHSSATVVVRPLAAANSVSSVLLCVSADSLIDSQSWSTVGIVWPRVCVMVSVLFTMSVFFMKPPSPYADRFLGRIGTQVVSCILFSVIGVAMFCTAGFVGQCRGRSCLHLRPKRRSRTL